jgi:hypothetical protein
MRDDFAKEKESALSLLSSAVQQEVTRLLGLEPSELATIINSGVMSSKTTEALTYLIELRIIAT